MNLVIRHLKDSQDKQIMIELKKDYSSLNTDSLDLYHT